MGGIDLTSFIHIASGLLVGVIVGGVVAYSVLAKRMVRWPTVFENEYEAAYKAKHTIASVIVVGMFLVVTMLFTGVVDITDATVSAFAGFIFGHVSNKVDPIMQNYFGSTPPKEDKDEPKEHSSSSK